MAEAEINLYPAAQEEKYMSALNTEIHGMEEGSACPTRRHGKGAEEPELRSLTDKIFSGQRGMEDRWIN